MYDFSFVISNCTRIIIMNIEDKIRDTLNVKTCKKIPGKGGGGCINSGECYQVNVGETDEQLIFVKLCSKENAYEIISGESESLKTIKATQQIKVPDPLGIVREPGSQKVALLMSFIDMKPLNKLQGQLGEQLAKLHVHNQQMIEQQVYESSFISSSKNRDELKPVTEYGFHCVTNCGAIAQNNEWQLDWISFFARNRLEHQIKLIGQNYHDRQVNELWSELQLKIAKYFKTSSGNVIEIQPSLLHGDLWSGNVCESNDQSYIFDPCCFYGHSEYDLAIGDMFGGFRQKFHEHYRKTISKVEGMEKRIELYQLFHYLNHWNHFGGGYRDQSLNLMRKLNRI